MEASTLAEAAIRETLAREGPITFARFMEMALYTAPGAYYGSAVERIGPRGDYFTSPVVHPSFGALVARQVEQVWIALGRPERFDLVEVGAGTGALARDLLDYTSRRSPAFHEALSYVAVERAPALTQVGVQGAAGPTARLGVSPNPPKIGSRTSFPEEPLEGCVLSNELLDAFPVHRVVVADGRLREIYVRVQDGRLSEVLEEPSDPRLAAYFERLGFLPPEGCRAEVNLAVLDWMAQVAGSLRRGAVLTLDYGYPAEGLYSPRHSDGTLLCFYHHTANSDPYLRIGEQDLTAHVDFSSVERVGSEHGLRPLGLATQRSFLLALGMDAYLAMLPRLGLPRVEFEANRRAMEELLNPTGLGRVGVLIQHRGLEGFDAAGLRVRGLRSDDLGRDLSLEAPPLLSPSHMRLNAPPETEQLMDAEGMWKELFGEGEE